MWIFKPKITEKAAKQQEKQKIHTFVVPVQVNKIEIKQALYKQFGVEVECVNTANYLGKKKIRYTRNQVMRGAQKNYKKVFVKLKKGSELNMYKTEA